APHPGSAPARALEGSEQPAIGVGGLATLLDRDAFAAPEEPRELGLGRRELRRDTRDLAQRDAELERALQVAPPLRRLPRVPPVEDERLRQVRALRDGEHARPELVVLALEV